MDEMRCGECGTAIEKGMTECPSCGCPIEQRPVKEKKRLKCYIMPILSIVLGIAIIIMGIQVMGKKTQMNTYTARRYAADSAKFGADFYTYVYDASDMMVDELSDINGGIALLSESMETAANVIYYPVGMLIVAIGLGVVALSCTHIGREH